MNDIIKLYDYNLLMFTSWQYLNRVPVTANHMCQTWSFIVWFAQCSVSCV